MRFGAWALVHGAAAKCLRPCALWRVRCAAARCPRLRTLWRSHVGPHEYIYTYIVTYCSIHTCLIYGTTVDDILEFSLLSFSSLKDHRNIGTIGCTIYLPVCLLAYIQAKAVQKVGKVVCIPGNFLSSWHVATSNNKKIGCS